MNMRTDFSKDSIQEAERSLLQLADYLYIHSNIKPYSRVIYILSRLIALNSDLKMINDSKTVLLKLKNKFPDLLEEQDYNSDYIFGLLKNDFIRIKNVVLNILELAPKGTDTLGLIFNTLLRGKFEAGEGLGTYLTPEEVVEIMVNISISFFKKYNKKNKTIYFADITGGTGRFIYKFINLCKIINIKYKAIISDQSKFSLDLAKINFILSGDIENVNIINVKDSILDDNINKYLGKINIICTNPPFGTNKYEYSTELKYIFNDNELKILNMISEKSKNDPALIFLLKNFKLLSNNGIMGIILPDGIIYSNIFFYIINQNYDGFYFNILSVISLPVVTFALGGTVAKTSFIIINKSRKNIKTDIYIANADHIGFLKKGNKRIIDNAGNDLFKIQEDIFSNSIKYGKLVSKEIAFKRKCFNKKCLSLNKNIVLVRNYLKQTNNKIYYHISILDVDETGYINFEKILKNSPITKPIICEPYDILVSCINPKIWRTTIVPKIKDFLWTCSSEYAVFRCKDYEESIKLYFSIMQNNFIESAVSYAKGTSSSRQRINKNDLLKIKIDIPNDSQIDKLKKLFKLRNENYINRLKDLSISSSLWSRTC